MKIVNFELFDALKKDEDSVPDLYKPGPYWRHKTIKTRQQLVRRGLSNFRGYNSGVGTSYCDNVIIDCLNEEVSLFNDIFNFMISKIPILKRVRAIMDQNRSLAIQIHKEKMLVLQKFLSLDDTTKKLLTKFSLENTTEFDCVSKVILSGKSYSTHYLEIARALAVIANKINLHSVRTMLEIGGGFGANIHVILQNYNNVKKVIYLDIFPNLFVGTEYLRSIYGDSVKDYLSLRERGEISFSDNDDLEIMCIPPWMIEKLNCEIDYFHNAHSFVEMPDFVVANYAKFIEGFLSSSARVCMVSYDEFDENTSLNPDKLPGYFGSLNFSKSYHKYLLNSDRRFYLYLSV